MACLKYYKSGDYNYCWTAWDEPNWDRCVPNDDPDEVLYFSCCARVIVSGHHGQDGVQNMDTVRMVENVSTDVSSTEPSIYKCYVEAGYVPKPILTECSPSPIKLTHLLLRNILLGFSIAAIQFWTDELFIVEVKMNCQATFNSIIDILGYPAKY